MNIRTLLLLGLAANAAAGPFAPPAGQEGSTAIAWDSPTISAWATNVVIDRGSENASEPDSPLASFGTAADALGESDAAPFDPTPVVSLGDGGVATATFARPIIDAPGPDFAVFENAFNDTFLELAFVEVSSDGTNFLRFPSTSLTQVETQVTDALDTTDIDGLAGKYAAGFGTPFDLADLPTDSLVDTSKITHVRIIDVVGSISPSLASRDSGGRIINDPFPTGFTSSGFDLDAIAVINESPTNFAEWSSLYFSDSEPDESADPDGDGFPNEIEYLLGGDPLAGASLVEFHPITASFVLERDFSRTGVDLYVYAGTELDDLQLVGHIDSAQQQWISSDPQVVFVEQNGGRFEIFQVLTTTRTFVVLSTAAPVE